MDGKNVFAITALAFTSLLIARPCSAQEFSTLEGTYEIRSNNDLRTSAISKIVLDRYKGQPQGHLWFYSANGDVDWGTCVLKEFSQPGNNQNHQYVGHLKHNNDEAFLILQPYPNQLNVQSYTHYSNADAKHPNLFCSDQLNRSTK